MGWLKDYHVLPLSNILMSLYLHNSGKSMVINVQAFFFNPTFPDSYHLSTNRIILTNTNFSNLIKTDQQIQKLSHRFVS